jgi:peptidyl-prolyl cis-trans isomerase C
VLSLGSCSKVAGVDEHGRDQNRGALIARIGAVELREEDVQRAIARDPGASRERFETPAARGELIDGLIRFELLAQAADKAGLTKDPDAIHALQQIAVTKLVNQTLGAVASPDSITKADVEREYLARQGRDFTLPPAAHVRHIRVAIPKVAERLANRAKALAADDDRGFAALAASSSEDATTRALGGDLGFIDRNSRLPPALIDAALSLKTPGEVTGPLAIDGGYEVVRLINLRTAAVSPLSSVEEPIRQRLYRDRRAKALDDLVARLRNETAVEVVNR